jgi:proline iminopeptidase
LTADADAIRQFLGIDKWAVVGHSFGGMVAIEYAIRYPDQITHLVLLDAASDGIWVRQKASIELQRRGFSRLVVETATRFYRGQIVRSEFIKSMLILARAYYSRPSVAFILKEALHGLKIRANPEVCIYASRELLSGWSVTDRLDQIKAQALIVAGIDDFLCPPEHQKEMQKGIKGAELHLLSGAGHNAHMEQPGKMFDIISGFLRNR